MRDNAIHFLRHLFYAEETVLLAGCHAVETCPHVFVAPSAIPAVVYVNPGAFFHNGLIKYFLQDKEIIGADEYDSARSLFMPVSGKNFVRANPVSRCLDCPGITPFGAVSASLFTCPGKKTFAFFILSSVFLNELLVIMSFF